MQTSVRPADCDSISIYHPLAAPPPHAAVPSVAIYLPRGPVLSNPEHDALNISTLRSILPCTIVQVNYRHGRDASFPMPLHDVMHGYDWITEHLLAKRAISRPGRSDYVGRIAVAGELFGGTLATAIALSECRIGEPGIVAAAISNPIVDWPSLDGEEVDLDNPQAPLSTSSSDSPLNARALLAHRRSIFARADAYFDVFASPILFFRSPGVEVPPDDPLETLSDMDELALNEQEDFFRQQLALSALSSPPPTAQTQANTLEEAALSSPELTGGLEMEEKKMRRASRRFPSPTLKLRLPHFRLTAGANTLLADPTCEMACALQKSFERQGKIAALAHLQTPDMVDFCTYEGLGLWDETHEGRGRAFEAAQWLRRTLLQTPASLETDDV